MYLHVPVAPDDNQVQALNQQIENKLKELESKTGDTVSAEVIKQVEERFKLYDNQLTNLRKDLEIKDKRINSLDLRVDELEKETKTNKKQYDKKIKELENFCKQKIKSKIESILMNSLQHVTYVKKYLKMQLI